MTVFTAHVPQSDLAARACRASQTVSLQPNAVLTLSGQDAAAYWGSE
jgi:hypothetical protein